MKNFFNAGVFRFVEKSRWNKLTAWKKLKKFSIECDSYVSSAFNLIVRERWKNQIWKSKESAIVNLL